MLKAHLLLFLTLFSFAHAQNEIFNDISDINATYFYKDSIKFNFAEFGNVTNAMYSFDNKTQIGGLFSYKSTKYDSTLETHFDVPSIYFIYSGEENFISVGNRHIVEDIIINDSLSTKSAVNRAFINYCTGKNHTKFSVGLNAELGTNVKYLDSLKYTNSIYALNLNIGTLLKLGWNSEFILNFDFPLIKDSLRLFDRDENGSTKYPNYIPHINTGFLKHSNNHREMLIFSWSSLQKDILVNEISNQKIFKGFEDQQMRIFGVKGNINNELFGIAYSAKMIYENRGIWKDESKSKNIGELYFKEYPISLAVQKELFSKIMVLAFNIKPLILDFYSSRSFNFYLDNSVNMNDVEYELKYTIDVFNDMTLGSKISTDLNFGIGGGYYLTNPYYDKLLQFNNYRDLEIKNQIFSDNLIYSDDLLAYKRARGFISTGFKTTIFSSVVLDGYYEFNIFRDTKNKTKTLSDQLFIGNNLLLKVYYLF